MNKIWYKKHEDEIVKKTILKIISNKTNSNQKNMIKFERLKNHRGEIEKHL
jgi:hypothetical protein